MGPVYKEVEVLTKIGYEIYVDSAGNKCWYLNGVLHREGGPAIEYYDGDKSWYLNGVLHREDGPARDWGVASEWYLNDDFITEQEFNEVWNCPMEKLPLYINTPLAPIVARRCQNPSICGRIPPIKLNLKGDPTK